MKVLMVCLGNICRSPLAEGILRHKAKLKNYSITVDSCGTAAYHVGENPDSRSVAIAQKYGIDISNLKARKFSENDFKTFDYIFTMDSENTKNVLDLSNNQIDKNKVIQILNLLNPGSNQKVPDPYYGNMQHFEEVYQLLNKACDKIILLYEEKLNAI